MSIKSVCVVGSGLSLVSAAIVLGRHLQPYGIRVTAIRLPQENNNIQAITLGAEFVSLCDILKLDIRDILQSTQGVFSLGHSLSTAEKHWFVPYGCYGLTQAAAQLEQGIFRFLKLDKRFSLDDFSLAAAANKNNSFAIPGSERQDLLAALTYGVNLNPTLYELYLLGKCKEAGLEIMEAKNVADVSIDECGFIQAVELDDTRRIDADFWVDASGEQKVLTGRVNFAWQQSAWQNGTHIVRAEKPISSNAVPSSVALKETSWGWVKITALEGRIFYESVFNASDIEPKAVCDWMESNLGAKNVSVQPFSAGCLENAWVANCLSVGHAGVNFGNVFVGELDLLHAALMQFLEVFPSNKDSAYSQSYFNKSWNKFIEDTGDFSALLYFKPRGVFPYDGLTKTLQRKIELFERLGKFEVSETDALTDQQWYAMLVGVGYLPELDCATLSNINDESLKATMKQLVALLKKTAVGMPSHKEFIAKCLH